MSTGYNWATVLHSRDWHNIVNQLCFNLKKKKKGKKTGDTLVKGWDRRRNNQRRQRRNKEGWVDGLRNQGRGVLEQRRDAALSGGARRSESHSFIHSAEIYWTATLWLAPFQVLRESYEVNITGKTPHPSGNFIQAEERKLKQINKYMVHIHIKLSICIGLNSDPQEYTSKSWPLALWMWFYLEMGYLQM